MIAVIFEAEPNAATRDDYFRNRRRTALAVG